MGDFGVDPDLIEQPGGGPGHDLLDALRLRVERRHRRADDRAHPRQLEHVLEMDVVEGRFAHRQHQLAPLFEDHVGGAMNQVIAEAVGDRGQRPHAAGHDDHPVGDERPARDRGALIAGGVDARRQPFDVFGPIRRLVQQGPHRPLAHHQVRLDAGVLQHLQHPDGDDRAGRAGHPDDDPPRL